MPEMPLAAMAAGRHVRVPLLIGTNKNEGSIFLPLLPFIAAPGVSFPLKDGDVERVMHHVFDPDAASGDVADLTALLDAYPPGEFGEPLPTWLAWASSYLWPKRLLRLWPSMIFVVFNL